MRNKDYYSAFLDDYDKIVVYMSRNSYEGQSNKFYLKDSKGTITELFIQSIEQVPMNDNKYTLRLSRSIEIGEEYVVIHQHARTTPLQYAGIVKTSRFDDEFYYDGDDLGYTFSNAQTHFALWAPTAYRVKVEIIKNDVVRTYEMQRSDKGVFRYAILENLENAQYVYYVRVNGTWKETIDPYGVASTMNSKRSVIIDPSKLRFHDTELAPMKSNCDAIIYEASVRDFTMQLNSVQNPGTFRAFVEENDLTMEQQTGFTYLKSLGITHVQLLPVFDFGSVDETYPKLFYNWGYDPVQYRCLEGSYASDCSNPYSRMFEMIELVEKCHKNGIRVNLDVVFNHVYDKDTHAFDITVPNYYFQMNEAGEFSNGTWCGNDIDSRRKMCSKYIVDACRYIVKTYHIDGLRFDLMGILDIDTINKIHQECTAINPDFMLYGEGWDMPSLLDYTKRASIRNNWHMPHVAHFSDRFRDVAKGKTDMNEVASKGFFTGATYLIDIMKNCLCASSIEHFFDRMFENPDHVINYVECHDNQTSWDKLKECCKEDTREVRILKHEMLIAATLFAQGIPFIHSGQEFCRTKHGLPNTYSEKDEINQLDYTRKQRYASVVEWTKKCISIRKTHPSFRYSTAEEIIHNVDFEDIHQQVLIYKVKDKKEEVRVYFNPTGNFFNHTLTEEYHLLAETVPANLLTTKEVIIPPFSTIVLIKQIH